MRAGDACVGVALTTIAGQDATRCELFAYWTLKHRLEARIGALLGLDEVQATAVADQQLRRFPRQERARIRSRVELKSELADLKLVDPT